MQNQKRDFTKSRFTKRIAITETDYQWIKNNRGKKSAAGFLEVVVAYVKSFKNLTGLVGESGQQALFKKQKSK